MVNVELAGGEEDRERARACAETGTGAETGSKEPEERPDEVRGG